MAVGELRRFCRIEADLRVLQDRGQPHKCEDLGLEQRAVAPFFIYRVVGDGGQEVSS